MALIRSELKQFRGKGKKKAILSRRIAKRVWLGVVVHKRNKQLPCHIHNRPTSRVTDFCKRFSTTSRSRHFFAHVIHRFRESEIFSQLRSSRDLHRLQSASRRQKRAAKKPSMRGPPLEGNVSKKPKESMKSSARTSRGSRGRGANSGCICRN
jgi:hypothetical protein